MTLALLAAGLFCNKIDREITSAINRLNADLKECEQELSQSAKEVDQARAIDAFGCIEKKADEFLKKSMTILSQEPGLAKEYEKQIMKHRKELATTRRILADVKLSVHRLRAAGLFDKPEVKRAATQAYMKVYYAGADIKRQNRIP